MSSSLSITKTLNNTGWTITATVTSGTTLPAAMFVYNNTGTSTLGTYFGLINVKDLARIQIWTGTPLQIFGNAYVRYTVGTINITDGSNPDTVIATLVANAKILSTAYQALSSSTTVYNIP